MYVKITASDQDLESFCYLPLVSGQVYQANYAKINGTECNTFFDVIFNDEITVRGVHESRLQILTQDEIREYRINQIIC
jgi:hypothetical protein